MMASSSFFKKMKKIYHFAKFLIDNTFLKVIVEQISNRNQRLLIGCVDLGLVLTLFLEMMAYP